MADTFEVETRTCKMTFPTLALFEEAVYSVHFAHCGFGPSLFTNDRFHFLTKWLDVLRICCKVEKRMSEALQSNINSAGLCGP